MSISARIEQKSTEQLLTRLGLAIGEAKLARTTIKLNVLAGRSEPREPISRRLMLVNREIELLEMKLVRIRCEVNRG